MTIKAISFTPSFHKKINKQTSLVVLELRAVPLARVGNGSKCRQGPDIVDLRLYDRACHLCREDQARQPRPSILAGQVRRAGTDC